MIGCVPFYDFAQTDKVETNETSIKTAAEVSFCTVKGLFYTVQVGVFSRLIPDAEFPEEVQPLYCIHRKDGLYAYFSGIYDSRFDAMAKRFQIARLGIYDAYVATYYNGKKVSMAVADNLLEKKGKSILYNYNDDDLITETE